MDNNNNQSDKIQIVVSPMQLKPGVIDPRHLSVPITPKLGDLFYSNGTSFIKLSPGSAGQVLTVSSTGAPVWATCILTGLAANKPTSGQFVGQGYLASDTPKMWWWVGASWKGVTIA